MPDPMPLARLAELREAAAKRTPGPWTWHARSAGGAERDRDDVLGYGIDGPDEPQLDRERFARRADAVLAAAAPELLAEVERLSLAYDRQDHAVIAHAAATIPFAADRDRARGIAVALEQQNAAAADLHQPYAIYKECGHDHDEADAAFGRAVEVEDIGYTCADGLMYRICTSCCCDRYADGMVLGQSEACADGRHGHDHTTAGPICPTSAALDGGS